MSPAAQRRQASTTPLSREEAARAALELVDAEGLDRLSMRRLAARLGVGTMTLYGHFASKQDLLDAVIDVAGQEEPPPLEGPWRERLQALMVAARELLLRHPSLVEIRARQPVLRPRSLRWAETVLKILEEAGFESEEAARAFRLLFTYVFGFALFSPATAEVRAREAAHEAVAALPPEFYPHLSAAIDEASGAMAGDEAFLYGLERILDGLEARLPS